MKKRISGVLLDGTTGTSVRVATAISVSEGEHATIEVEVVGQDGVAIDYADFTRCVLTIRAALDDATPIVAREGTGAVNILTFQIAGGEVTAGNKVFDVYLLDSLDRAYFVTEVATWAVTDSAGAPVGDTPGPSYQTFEESVTVAATDTVTVTYPTAFVDATHYLSPGAPYISDGNGTATMNVTARTAAGFTVTFSAVVTGSFSYKAKGVSA